MFIRAPLLVLLLKVFMIGLNVKISFLAVFELSEEKLLDECLISCFQESFLNLCSVLFLSKMLKCCFLFKGLFLGSERHFSQAEVKVKR